MTLLDKNEKAWKQRNKALLKQLYSITIDNNIITADREAGEDLWNSDDGQGLVFKQQTGSGSGGKMLRKAVSAADLRDLFCVWIVGWTTHPGTAWAV